MCHGTNAGTGKHAGHFDGTVNLVPPVDTVSFGSICEECHGYDGQLGDRTTQHAGGAKLSVKF